MSFGDNLNSYFPYDYLISSMDGVESNYVIFFMDYVAQTLMY